MYKEANKKNINYIVFYLEGSLMGLLNREGKNEKEITLTYDKVNEDLIKALEGKSIYEKLQIVIDNRNLTTIHAIEYFIEVLDLLRSNHIPEAQQELCKKAQKYLRDKVLVMYDENRFLDPENAVRRLLDGNKDKIEHLYTALQQWILSLLKIKSLESVKIKAEYHWYNSCLSIVSGTNDKTIINGNLFVKETIREIVFLRTIGVYLGEPDFKCEIADPSDKFGIRIMSGEKNH